MRVEMIVVAAAWLLNAGCAASQAPGQVPGADRAEGADTALPLDCGAAIPGAEAVLIPGAVVMLGELHGTAEMPGFMGSLACHTAAAGHPVRLGLEMKQGDQSAVDAYLLSDGGVAARKTLLAAPHWQREQQDGRSSEAMLGLIETAHYLRARGHPVTVFAFDAEAHQDWNDRDHQMARAILDQARGDAIVLVLTGNLHNRTVPGLPWDGDAIPMGVHIAKAREQVVSLQPGYTGGTAWNCRQDGCRGFTVGGRPEYEEPRIELSGDEPGRDGIFAVGAITASPPAIGVASATGSSALWGTTENPDAAPEVAAQFGRLIGRWQCHGENLGKDGTWTETPGTSIWTWFYTLDGHAVQDVWQSAAGGVGTNLRIYNREAGEWYAVWATGTQGFFDRFTARAQENGDIVMTGERRASKQFQAHTGRITFHHITPERFDWKYEARGQAVWTEFARISCERAGARAQVP